MSMTDQGAAPAADATKTNASTADDKSQVKAEETKTTEAATEADTQDGSTTTDEDAEEKRNKRATRSFQRRVNELTARGREAEARAAAAEARARELEGKLAKPTQSDDLKPPRIEEFKGSYEEFELAREAYVAEKTRRATLKEIEARQTAFQEKASREAEAKRINEARNRFEKTAETVAEHYEDFDDAMDDMWRGQIPVIALNDAIAEYIVEHSERGPELAYHLRNNQADADRIGKLSPLAQVRELARLEASLPKPAAKTTQAPPPPKQVGSRGGADGKDPEKMSIEEMRKATKTVRKVDY